MVQIKAFSFLSLLAVVSAHQNMHQFWVNDETPGFEVGIRKPPSNSPVEDVTKNDIVCNVGGTSGAGVKTIEAKAGDKITVQWDQSTHPGPITHMLHGPVASAEAATGVGEWFKIDELDYVGGKWANEIMAAKDMKHTFTIPEGVASGEYLLRSEMLALHASQTLGGGQFYIGCIQLKIIGSSTAATCGPKITLPGAYKATDSNIYIPNYYNGFDATNYKAPGGSVATCGAGSSTPAPTSEKSTVPEPTTIASTTTSIPESSPTATPDDVVPSPATTPTPSQPSGEETPAETLTPSSSKPVSSATPTSAVPAPATGLPANTKLSSVLSWLSKFITAHPADFNSDTALKRRHARQF